MASGTMTSKGQITIPREVRESLGLKSGTRVEFALTADGEWRLRPVRTHGLSGLAGLLHYDGPALTIEQMDEAVAEGAGQTSR